MDRLRPSLYDRKVKLPYDSATHTVGFYVSPGFQLLDFAGPAGAFEAANKELESAVYRVSVLAAHEGAVTNSLGIAIAAASLDDAVLDTLIVIGGRIDPHLSAGLLGRIVDASSRCRRVASVCVGAFTLAAAGLLDGRRATTHWRYAARLQREYPSVRVEADRIFCRDGNVWTSAGITAGIDLALALIEEDHGFAIAKGVAQHLVVYHRRHGGQSQFAASVDLAPKNDRISAALGFARDHIAEVLTVERLAESAGMSLRQFTRAFRAQTGATPARVVERLRTDLARGRIETTIEPVERIAEAVGFGDAENMRRAFIRIYGQPPNRSGEQLGRGGVSGRTLSRQSETKRRAILNPRAESLCGRRIAPQKTVATRGSRIGFVPPAMSALGQHPASRWPELSDRLGVRDPPFEPVSNLCFSPLA